MATEMIRNAEILIMICNLFNSYMSIKCPDALNVQVIISTGLLQKELFNNNNNKEILFLAVSFSTDGATKVGYYSEMLKKGDSGEDVEPINGDIILYL